jgi:hypothetical protein
MLPSFFLTSLPLCLVLPYLFAIYSSTVVIIWTNYFSPRISAARIHRATQGINEAEATLARLTDERKRLASELQNVQEMTQDIINADEALYLIYYHKKEETKNKERELKKTKKISHSIHVGLVFRNSFTLPGVGR